MRMFLLELIKDQSAIPMKLFIWFGRCVSKTNNADKSPHEHAVYHWHHQLTKCGALSRNPFQVTVLCHWIRWIMNKLGNIFIIHWYLFECDSSAPSPLKVWISDSLIIMGKFRANIAIEMVNTPFFEWFKHSFWYPYCMACETLCKRVKKHDRMLYVYVCGKYLRVHHFFWTHHGFSILIRGQRMQSVC